MSATQHKVRLLQRIADRTAHMGIIGIGYVGLPLAMVFAEAGFKVTGIDVSDVAIVYAQTHYAHENILYIVQDILSLSKDALGLFDVIVCFETIEHIADRCV